MYSNSCCSCSFKPEIIKISRPSYNMYSNNILNFQVSSKISNAYTKKILKLIEGTTLLMVPLPRLMTGSLHMYRVSKRKKYAGDHLVLDPQLVLIQSFPSLITVTNVKKPSLSYYLPSPGDSLVGFIPFTNSL